MPLFRKEYFHTALLELYVSQLSLAVSQNIMSFLSSHFWILNIVLLHMMSKLLSKPAAHSRLECTMIFVRICSLELTQDAESQSQSADQS